MDNEQYIESGLSVGTMKIANKYEIFTEGEIDAINNKIPELDGRVDIIEDEIEEINSSLNDKASQSDLEFERKRIDNLTSLKEGSTTGDAELIDGRVGSDGFVYNNIGAAIREQNNYISVGLSDLKDNMFSRGVKTINFRNINNLKSIEGNYSANVLKSTKITFSPTSDYQSYYYYVNEDEEFYVSGEIPIYFAIVVLKNPTREFYISGGNSITMDGTECVRYRKSEGNLPSEDKKLSVAKGSLIAFTVRSNTDCEITYSNKITFELNKNVKLNTTQIEQVIKDVYNESNANDYFNVTTDSNNIYYYIPTFNKNYYLKYKFEHYTNEKINANGWVQRTVDLVKYENGDYVLQYQIITEGEWEMAVKLDGRPDFIGCKNHGSEINFYEKMYVDGVPFEHEDNLDFICKEIVVIQKSYMYDPNDEVTLVGHHTKKHTITIDGIKIRQKIEWKKDNLLNYSYVAMLPALRGNDNVSTIQITDTFFDEITYDEYDVSIGGFGGYPLSKVNRDEMTLIGKNSGVYLNLKCNIKNRLNEALSYCQNTVDKYNKLYMSYCGNSYNVKSGDIWEWESIYTIKHKI